MLAAAALMAIAAPFGTSDAPLGERLGFWLIGAAGSFAAAKLLDFALRSLHRLRERPKTRALALIAIVTPPAAVIASWAAAVLHHQPVSWAQCWRTMPQIALVGVAFSALLGLVDRPRIRAAAPVDASPPDPSLDSLLPARLAGARLFAIEAKDHYVRVNTDRGCALVLASLEAAIAKTQGLDGQRVHRSWWVAKAAVTNVQRGGGRAVLSLSSGAQAPVSRRYARWLRADGWY
jgi:LytTr DNA-binding domain